MEHNLNEIASDLVREKLNKYWPNFDLVAYAIYDKNNVYLFNHPKYKESHPDTYKLLKWIEQFVGNTLILYEDYPTAIADLNYYNDYEGIYSILVHELFHGYQYLQGEKRFPNEILGITYPITLENVELRSRERKCLFHALLEPDCSKKMEFLKDFITYREMRTELVGEHVNYENMIETVEGPAWYVEFKAYCYKSSLPSDQILKKYEVNLINIFEANANIRRSCYSSGLFICLLLDELSPDWKEKFFNTDLTLFDLMKQFYYETNSQSFDGIISSETREAVTHVISLRKKEFEVFESQSDIHLFIEGEISALQFDPMNIIPFEGKLLHKNFIKVKINNNEYFIQKPCITYVENGISTFNKIHLILQESPIENADSLIVNGVGEIYGRYTKKDNVFYVSIN